MRTKALLLTAALSAAGVATSMAQVYSQNAVGYVNIKVLANEFAGINNPLTAANNTLASLIPAPPENTALYRFGPSGFSIAVYAQDDSGNLNWGANATDVLLPGEGAFIKNGGAADFTITFVGDVSQGSLTHAVPAGFSIQASEVPQGGALDTVLGFTPQLGDSVYQYVPGTGFTINNYALDDNNNPAWDAGSSPSIAVGEGFWVNTTGVHPAWARTFSVNTP